MNPSSHRPFMGGGGDNDHLDTPRQRPSGPVWLLALVAVLLIGTLAVWFIPQHPDAPKPQAANDAGQQAAAAPQPTAEPDASTPQPEAAPAEPAAAAASAPEAGQGDSSTPEDVITFTATAQVWVGVRNAKGESVLGRLLNEGDTVSVGGELPLSVTVGNKTAVTVTVRGQPFDLNQFARRGVVARFTVGPADSSP